MSAHSHTRGYILISSEIEVEFEKLQEDLKPNRVVGFIEDKFLLEHSKAVVKEAYISESSVKYIVIGANEFHTVAQNRLHLFYCYT
jgi:DNA polymerase-3 subunit delta'